MNRTAFAALLSLAAPVATGWVPCDQPGITPPVPIHRAAPAFPQSVREVGIEGSVELSLVVLRDGSVGWVRVVRAEPRGYFEQAATAGVRGWRFRPARQEGVPVECRMLTRVRFALVDTVGTQGSAQDADRPTPSYPPALLRERIEGYAEVEFERAPDGSVRDARVINAMPRGEFEKAALAAVRGWKPAAAGPAPRETRRFEFRLPDTTLARVPALTLGNAPFPMAACEKGTSGRVVLEVETDAAGQVRATRILSATPPGLFDASALAIARGSRLTPAYRDGQPMGATALLTLDFNPALATCPGVHAPDRDPPPARRPQPRVSRHDEQAAGRADPWASLSRGTAQPVP